MMNVNDAVKVLMAAGLPVTPPHVLVTRWLALLVDDNHRYLDVLHESGPQVGGTRYTFVAVTDTAVCYLKAEHENEGWDQQRIDVLEQSQLLTPKKLVAWRRPLTSIVEVSLGGDKSLWVPAADGNWESPCYELNFRGDSLEIPLQSPHRSRKAPNPIPVIVDLNAAWRRNHQV